MRRREFIAGVASVVARPLVAHAQQQGKLPTVGFRREHAIGLGVIGFGFRAAAQ